MIWRFPGGNMLWMVDIPPGALEERRAAVAQAVGQLVEDLLGPEPDDETVAFFEQPRLTLIVGPLLFGGHA